MQNSKETKNPCWWERWSYPHPLSHCSGMTCTNESNVVEQKLSCIINVQRELIWPMYGFSSRHPQGYKNKKGKLWFKERGDLVKGYWLAWHWIARKARNQTWTPGNQSHQSQAAERIQRQPYWHHLEQWTVQVFRAEPWTPLLIMLPTKCGLTSWLFVYTHCLIWGELHHSSGWCSAQGGAGVARLVLQ